MDRAEIEKLASLEGSHWWYAARRAVLHRYARGLPAGSAVDVGAGAGGNTMVLRELGWSATAVELSSTGAVIARGRGVPTVRADATALPFNADEFDLLVSMDLWEHIEDDSRAAAESFRVLRPGGRLFLAVPCDMALWSDHDLAVGHVRRYSRKELVSLARGAGFVDVEVKSWNVLLRPAVRVYRRQTRSVDAGESSSDLQPVARPLNALLRGAIELERWLPVGRRRGVTLLMTAAKPA